MVGCVDLAGGNAPVDCAGGGDRFSASVFKVCSPS
jgi:hypothetical protein